MEQCQLGNNDDNYKLEKINPSVMILWTILYLEGVQCLSNLKRLPMIGLDPLDRQSAQAHRLMFLVAEVLLVVEVETVLAVSGLLVKKGTIPRESATPDEEEKAVLSSNVLVAT